ncbi:helix-turn-helix domain-containing protein [Rapidithrix thailandica]|uniref:Helix-turn-helix domain-containing protein n=1 Tax=Rapidithrix thailandica TaxID=413964 RepID=A0AAW9RV78_9BACT
MHERKIPIDLECGINVFTLALGGKWKFCIIDCIHRGIQRPNEIHKSIAVATPRVINMQLKELLDHGIIDKKVYQGLPLKVEYKLTELGESLLPIIDAMGQWGDEHRDTILVEEAYVQQS